ncbi:hypothetical protein PHLGIDRAFT_70511 [Phlebiopsis gigantea 11061_1 CR5-6]|uniref:NmrA-like domain-containing protein n=1 Tax=Phlebiopsis gigantea (strain 11061_1 CR5-6) TaxID=745531 RepID=A0A0C3NRB5_PHLG1|nr:hypothetical protein PHLGIDRAFT_70511 [Phlebiopsis gigantea 11061_1 CR5-6]
MSRRTILVVGATGKQGGAFIRAGVSASGEHDFHFLAVTRDPKSHSAQALVKLGDRVAVVTADVNDEQTVRKVFEDAKAEGGGVWGVYVALAFPGLGADASGEERQGKMMADLAHEYSVKHLIYSSASRRHESLDDTATLSGLAKVRIERHIKSLPDLSWTILQPTFFMENFEGYLGKIATSVLRVGQKKDTKIQLIAAEDIGRVGFAVMQSPETYNGKTVTVIGDALTMDELQEAYKRGAGKAMPSVANIFARGIIAMNTHTREV